MADYVGMAFVVGAALVQSVTESTLYGLLAMALGMVLAAYGVATRVRRRCYFGAGATVRAAGVMLALPFAGSTHRSPRARHQTAAGWVRSREPSGRIHNRRRAGSLLQSVLFKTDRAAAVLNHVFASTTGVEFTVDIWFRSEQEGRRLSHAIHGAVVPREDPSYQAHELAGWLTPVRFRWMLNRIAHVESQDERKAKLASLLEFLTGESELVAPAGESTSKRGSAPPPPSTIR